MGKDVSEWQVNDGPGYRAYFIRHDQALAVLLADGDKSTQTQNTQAAQALARQLYTEDYSL